MTILKTMGTINEKGNASHGILLVDDEQNILFALKRELHQWARDRNLEIFTALSAKEGLAFLDERAPVIDMIVSDLRMPEIKGSDFLLTVRKLYPRIITLLLTGYSETEEIVKAVGAGIFSYMLKPWDSTYLIGELTKAWDYGETRKQNEFYAKRLEDELKWAGELQKAILKPNLPANEKVEFRASYRAVPGLYCSGDYYDVISLGQDRYLLCIGDVAGHGVQAAIVTGILKAVIQTEYVGAIANGKLSPANFLGWLNQRMQFEFRSSAAMLITFFAGVLDLREGTFTYANAGHCHPFLVIPGSVTELPVSGTAIGFSQKVLHTERKLDIRSGAMLVLYTDGLTEVGKGVQILPVLQKVVPGPDFHRRLLEVVLETSGAPAYTDDVTILTAKLN